MPALRSLLPRARSSGPCSCQKQHLPFLGNGVTPSPCPAPSNRDVSSGSLQSHCWDVVSFGPGKRVTSTAPPHQESCDSCRGKETARLSNGRGYTSPNRGHHLRNPDGCAQLRCKTCQETNRQKAALWINNPTEARGAAGRSST